MNRVEGLASLQGRGEQRKPRFASRLEVPKLGSPALAPSAQGTTRYTGAPAVRQDNRGQELAQALGVAARYMERKDQINKQQFEARKPAYVQQVIEDNGNGSITAAQIGEIVPEAVPSLRWRVSEAVGMDWGKEKAAQIALEIQNNEHLQHDTEARQEFIDQKREEFFAEAGNDNDFWHGGAMSAFQKTIGAWEHRWLEQTANYHKQLSISQFKDEVSEVFVAQGPEALLTLDQQWNESGPLHHTTRNQAVVEAIIDLASDQGPELLDHIPDRFLNRKTKEKIREAKKTMAAAEITRARQLSWLEGEERKMRQRDIQVKILNDLSENPAAIPHFSEYPDEPELWGWIETVASSGAIEPAESAHTSRSLERQILLAATLGDASPLGLGPGEFTQENLTQEIMYHPAINSADRVALIEKIPTLLEGHNIIRDEDVSNAFDTSVKPLIDNVLKSGPSEELENILRGRSLVAHSTRMYYTNIEEQLVDFMDENGRWPTGAEKRPMVRAAAEEVQDWIVKNGGIAGAVNRNKENTHFGRTPLQPNRRQQSMQEQ